MLRFVIKGQADTGKLLNSELQVIGSDGGLAVLCGGWCICKLTPDGRLHRYECLPKDVGFQLDDLGRIQLRE